MAVDVKLFLAEAENIAAEEPGYQKGHYGQDGLCDCIGLMSPMLPIARLSSLRQTA